MSLVAHKYTPAEMSAHELEATFSGREHTVDYLLKSLRDQIHSATLSSFVVTGPRGAGKSTIIHMVALRISQDTTLRGAWLPVVFPEEQFNLVSLRDLLAGTLQIMANESVPTASEWLAKVEAEPNEEQSQQLALTGLREITRKTGKRLILFIENLNQLLEDHLDNQMKGTLRRLLMTDPFMMIIGSTVHIFDSLRRYDEAFFNYFGPVPLDRLDAEQVTELLRKRAIFDKNDQLLKELPEQQAKVKTLVYLTGGNPRFVLMLYELLSLRQVTTIVQYLRRLIDELTPLLKDEMENLPPQQRKIIHALMEKGGTAQPTDLTGPTRLPLNAINTQLKRLKEAQIVEVLGGGKGRAAHYTIPDKLFSIWYQMRYLSQNRRRIELFVEVLRIWFEEEERVKTLKSLSGQGGSVPHQLRECATTMEYFAASLKGTMHEELAAEICLLSWVKTDIHEAVLAYSDFIESEMQNNYADDASLKFKLARWLANHKDVRSAIAVLDQIIFNSESDDYTQGKALVFRGLFKGQIKKFEEAIADLTIALDKNRANNNLIACTYSCRGLLKWEFGDKEGAIKDYNTVLDISDLLVETKIFALENRSHAFEVVENFALAIRDCNSILELNKIQTETACNAYLRLGRLKTKIGDVQGALNDFSIVKESNVASEEITAAALLECIDLKLNAKDFSGALEDIEKTLNLQTIAKEKIARALLSRTIILIGDPTQWECVTLDYFRMLDLNLPDPEITAIAAHGLYGISHFKNEKSGNQDISGRIANNINLKNKENAREAALRVFNRIALFPSKDTWTVAWRSLASKLKPEIFEAISFLEPVCRVLEGQDRSLLDALPPEHREFALEVLAKFDA